MKMEEKVQRADWIYAVVCDPGPNEHFFGLHDKERDVDFIPAFTSRDDAADCLLTLPREKGRKYEVQAVHVDELKEIAEKNGFMVAMVDKDGHIIR
ncbi:hypothetical protein HNQ81_001722 [Desulfoprunum benzoelyticum]|uniref:Uncharacterized protein n=1 Tax=Desulfoprunum benzoelyticum TaxID=1506996 RepID=A0A840V4G8_9BACT|nr:DUF3110 domain-containing protein [Desulfoprunum benzoelyticum]MBB5347991.1 hypothetical protein [Desulfoprunum benzoelyticum]